MKERWASIYRHPVELELENRPINLDQTLQSSDLGSEGDEEGLLMENEFETRL